MSRTLRSAHNLVSTSVRHLSSSSAKGRIVTPHPIKFAATEGKTYFWCSCGLSKKQPFCDGTHKSPDVPFKPIKWECTKSKEYWICNCKQTSKGPFCDATHKQEAIQEAWKRQQGPTSS